jgi:hypothetical protein
MDLTLILKQKIQKSHLEPRWNSYAGLKWLSNTTKPSEADLLSHWDSV